MKYARTFYDTATRISNCDGICFEIESGDINGIVHVQGFSDAQRHCDRDKAILRFSWAFACSDESEYVYVALFHPLRLWPRSTTVVRPTEERFKKEITLKSVQDTRDCLPLRFANGETHRSAHKYNDLAFQLRCDERALAVCLTYYAGELFADPKQAYQSVVYELDYKELLWKRAARFTENDVMPEGEPHVSITHVGKLSDPGVPEGLKPSPITIVS